MSNQTEILNLYDHSLEKPYPSTVEWEHRACFPCSLGRYSCDMLTRPCKSCMERNTHWECLADMKIKRRACFGCRISKRLCDRKNPICSRCEASQIECLPFKSVSAKIYALEKENDQKDNWIKMKLSSCEIEENEPEQEIDIKTEIYFA
jgi:hypothetical protein